MRLDELLKISDFFYKLASEIDYDKITQSRDLLGVFRMDSIEQIDHKLQEAINKAVPKEIVEKLKESNWILDTPNGWNLNYGRVIVNREAPPPEFVTIQEKIRPLIEARGILVDHKSLKEKALQTPQVQSTMSEEIIDDEDIESELISQPSKKDYSMPSTCKIVYVGKPYINEEGIEETVDEYEASDLFSEVGITPGHDEMMYFAAVCEDKLVGAATIGKKDDSWAFEEYSEDDSEDDSEDIQKALKGANCYTFSIAIVPDWQKKNLGRELVSKIIKEVKYTLGGHSFNVWVVNPNMAKLLEDMGFDTERSEWSQDAPHMTLDL